MGNKNVGSLTVKKILLNLIVNIVNKFAKVNLICYTIEKRNIGNKSHPVKITKMENVNMEEKNAGLITPVKKYSMIMKMTM